MKNRMAMYEISTINLLNSICYITVFLSIKMPNPTFQRGKKIRQREKMKAAAFSINKEMMFYFLNIAFVSFQ